MLSWGHSVADLYRFTAGVCVCVLLKGNFSRPMHLRPTETELGEFCATDNGGNLTEPELRLEKL